MPSVKIQNTQQIIELVASHQIDLGIIEGTFNNEKLYTKVISDDEMFIVTSPNYPFVVDKTKVRSIRQLKDEMWILREKGSGTRQSAEKLFDMYNFSPKKIMELGSTQLIKEAVKEGLGISLLSKWAIADERNLGNISTIRVLEMPFKRTFSIVTHTLYQTKTVRTFIELLMATVEDLEEKMDVQ